MIVDIRTYTCHPGRLPEYVELYKTVGWPLQKQYLGRCLGWYTSVEGRLHTIVHLWAYDSQADREARRIAMHHDPAWKSFADKVAKLGAMAVQENSIMAPTDFFLADSAT